MFQQPKEKSLRVLAMPRSAKVECNIDGLDLSIPFMPNTVQIDMQSGLGQAKDNHLNTMLSERAAPGVLSLLPHLLEKENPAQSYVRRYRKGIHFEKLASIRECRELNRGEIHSLTNEQYFI